MAKSTPASTLQDLMVDANDQTKKQTTSLSDLKRSTDQQNTDLKNITKAKPNSPSSVSLGSVRDEIRALRTDNKRGDNVTRLPLPGSNGSLADAALTPTADTERIQKLEKLGDIIGRKTEMELGGSRNEILTARNTQAFQNFAGNTQDRGQLLEGATEDQINIFNRLEETMIKLQSADSEQSKKLRQELAELSGTLKETQDTGSKSKISGLIAGARTDAGSNQGRGFLGKIGNYLGEKIESGVEGKRNEKVQEFFDVFRSSSRSETAAELQGQQNQLQKNLNSPAGGQTPAKSPISGAPITRATDNVIPFPGTAARSGNKDIVSNVGKLIINAKAVTLKASVVNLDGGGNKATAAPLDSTPDSGTLRSDVKYQALDDETQQNEEDAGLGSGLDLDFDRFGKRGRGRGGRFTKLKRGFRNFKRGARNFARGAARGVTNLIGGGAGAFALGSLAIGGASVALAGNEQNKMFEAAAQGNVEKATAASRASSQFQSGAMGEFADPIQQQEAADKEAREALQAQAAKGNEAAKAKLAAMDKPLSETNPEAYARIEASKKKTAMLKEKGISYSKWRGKNVKEGTGLFGSNWFAEAATDKDVSAALNPATATPVSTTMGVSNKTGSSQVTASSLAAARNPAAPSGNKVTDVSIQNSQAKLDAAKPRVIVAPAPAAPTAPPVTNVTNNMPRGRVRPEESHLERYQARTSGSFIF
jgi:hypothetical protein